MTLIDEYESLKRSGTWIDRLNYIRSLSDRAPIETYLKQSASDDDRQMLLCLLLSSKNQVQLLERFQTDNLPVRQRIKAAEVWLRLEINEQQVHQFVVKVITDPDLPRRIKHALLKCLHKECRSKNFSSAFYYNLACELTQSLDHDQFNLDAHTLPYCSSAEHIVDLFSRWSLSRFEQIDQTSPLRSKLLRYKPLVAIELIEKDLALKYNSEGTLSNYFLVHRELLSNLAQREPKAMCRLAIALLNRLSKHKRFLPEFIENKQKRMFDKAPEEMIELIRLAASHDPGTIKSESRWDPSGSDVSRFDFLPSFSIDHYVQLFFVVLYDQCKWSLNHLPKILHLMLARDKSNLFSSRQRWKWFFEIVVQQRIGKGEFLKKLLKQGDRRCLPLLADYSELSVPLSRHLLVQLEQNELVKAEERLTFLRYEPLTSRIFDEFLSLFQQLGSDVNRRTQNYPLLLRSAVTTGPEHVDNALQWISKRLTNEQLIVIEAFLSQLNEYDDRFHLKIFPEHLERIEDVINLALNHLQRTTNTLTIVVNLGILLLKRAEFDRIEERQKKLQQFASKIIQRCYSIDATISLQRCLLPRSMPKARSLLAELLVVDVFPRLLSKGLLRELVELMTRAFDEPWREVPIDRFLVSFFFEHLRTSTSLQSAFKINEQSSLIEMFLRPRSTRFERLKRLLEEFGDVFLLDLRVQQLVVRSKEHRSLIDRLVQHDRSVQIDQQTQLFITLEPKIKNQKLPGLGVETLVRCAKLFTGEQREHLTKIILNSYLPDQQVSNLNKLKALRTLRRFSDTYSYTTQWIKDRTSSATPLTSRTSRVHCIRGADAQSIDDLLICLPATFDLSRDELIEQFDRLKDQLNATNAKYISCAILAISRKLPDRIFLKMYLDFVRTEQFQKLGITANKEILRLLVQYHHEPTLIETVIQPLWVTGPHPDVRACLITSLLHFLDRCGRDDASPIWTIFEQAAQDDYLPVIQALFVGTRGESPWPLARLASSDDRLFRAFVDRIQFRVFDHSSKLEAKLHAWSRVDYEHCDVRKLFDKAKELCVQFDQTANTCCEAALGKIIAACRHFSSDGSTADLLLDLVKTVMARREEVDVAQNALDARHDLPVYHRVHRLLNLLASDIDDIGIQSEASLRTIADLALQFDMTFASIAGRIRIGLAKSKEDLHAVLSHLEEHLIDSYAQRVISELGVQLGKKDRFCPFVEQLSVEEKLELVQWFVHEKQQESFVFDLLTTKIFPNVSADREQCRILLRHLRQCHNPYVRQKALEYTVPWQTEDGLADDNDMNTSYSLDMS